MQQEEEYWALKSRLNWATYGDANTSYFHVSTLVRRHRNKIRSLKNSVGEWITNEEDIKNLILSGFQEIFQTELVEAPLDSEVKFFSCCFLSEEERSCLAAPISDEEIKQGLWSLKAFKPPVLTDYTQVSKHNLKELVQKIF